MSGAVKISDINGKNLIKREELERLRGRIFVLKPEESEIAKNLGITEMGVFGAKFR